MRFASLFSYMHTTCIDHVTHPSALVLSSSKTLQFAKVPLLLPGPFLVLFLSFHIFLKR